MSESAAAPTPIKTINAIGGLPGSGKTSIVELAKANSGNTNFADDILAHSLGTADTSPKLYAMLKAIEAGQQVFVVDVAFVESKARQEFRETIRRHASGTVVHFVLFENDPEQCKRNVMADKSDRKKSERITGIARFSAQYQTSHRAAIRPVYRP